MIREAETYRKQVLVLKAEHWAGFSPLATDEQVRDFCQRHYLWAGRIEIKRTETVILARPQTDE